MGPTRVPEFDGLRAAAVAAVILAHTWGTAFPGGGYGVNIFFVLSGYLITTLLVKEHADTGRISLLKFYARRALRLTPALWIVLGFCLMTQVFSSKAAEHIPSIGAAALYVMNWYRAFEINNNQGWIVAHTWSLSVEEQFYLVWAPLLILTLSFGPKAPRWAAAVCFVLSTLACFTLSLSGSSLARIYHGFDTRSSDLFVGCLLALMPLSEAVREWAARWWLVPTAVLLAALWEPIIWLGGSQVIAVAKFPVIGIAINLMAAWLISAAPGHRRFAILRHPWVVYLGRISYGIYLWHFVLLQLLYSHGGSAIVSALIAIPMTVIFAAVSFELVERRFLAISARWFSPSANSLPAGKGFQALPASTAGADNRSRPAQMKSPASQRHSRRL
jgi:peptidoglycan/LPS O-acetylase OafA/YrhL